MRRIMIVGDVSSPNLGDPILSRSTEWIVNTVLKNRAEQATTVLFDIAGRNPTNSVASSKIKKFLRGKRLVLFLLQYKEILWWRIKDKARFKDRLVPLLDNCDLLVVAGGALISGAMFYALRLNYICEECQKRDIDVIFGPVGVERKRRYGLTYKLARHYLHLDNVKHIATRDNIEILRSALHISDCKTIPDPAICCKEAYNVEKKKNTSFRVGIGVISFIAFQSVIPLEGRLTEDELISFYCKLVQACIQKGYNYTLFINGSLDDKYICDKVIERLNIQDINVAPRPVEEKELIETISSFDYVVSARLHSLIIASSFGIPVSPILWSAKVGKFAELIHRKEQMLWPNSSMINKVIEDISSANNRDSLLVSEELKKSVLSYYSSVL